MSPIDYLNKTIAFVTHKFVIIGLILLIGFMVGCSLISVYNQEASLKVLYDAKVKDNQSEFDNMWKKISQTAEIPDKQKDAFKEVFVEYAKARTSSNAGSVMNWVQENNPAIDLSIYNQILNIVTASRDGWTMRQKELVDISRQYNNNLAIFPRNLMLKLCGFQVVDPQIITSSRTEKAFESGKDDDVSLFQTPKK